MKKNIICFVVMCTMLLSVAFGATYSDIENTKHEKAIEKLSDLKIVNGYSDGTYKPEKEISRAEMAKLLVIYLGLEEETKLYTNSSMFSDINKDDWFYGYVIVATNNGLIKGDGNGMFRPNDTVKFTEAYTMVIRMLGYGIITEQEGSWPDNYIAKAKELKLVENINGDIANGANRGSVAQILHNGIKYVNTKPEYALMKYTGLVVSRYKQMNNNYDKLNVKNTVNMNIKGNLKLVDKIIKTDEIYEHLPNIINNSEIKLSSNLDFKNKFLQILGKYTFKGEQLADCDIVIKEDSLYILLKGVYDKYIKTEDGSISFEEIWNIKENAKNISQEEIDFYVKVFLNYIGKENITLTKENIKLNNITKAVNKSTIEVNEQSTIKFQIEYNKELLNNQDMLNKVFEERKNQKIQQREEFKKLYMMYYNEEEMKEKFPRYFEEYTLDSCIKEINEKIDSLNEDLTYIQKQQDTLDGESILVSMYTEGELGKFVGFNIKKETVDDTYSSNTFKAMKFEIDTLLNEKEIYSQIKYEMSGLIIKASIEAKDRGNNVNDIISKINVIYMNEELIDASLNVTIEEIQNSEFKEIEIKDYMTEIDEKTEKRIEEFMINIQKKLGIYQYVQNSIAEDKFIIYKATYSVNKYSIRSKWIEIKTNTQNSDTSDSIDTSKVVAIVNGKKAYRMKSKPEYVTTDDMEVYYLDKDGKGYPYTIDGKTTYYFTDTLTDCKVTNFIKP